MGSTSAQGSCFMSVLSVNPSLVQNRQFGGSHSQGRVGFVVVVLLLFSFPISAIGGFSKLFQTTICLFQRRTWEIKIKHF